VYRIKCPCRDVGSFKLQGPALQHVKVCEGVGDANLIPELLPRRKPGKPPKPNSKPRAKQGKKEWELSDEEEEKGRGKRKIKPKERTVYTEWNSDSDSDDVDTSSALGGFDVTTVVGELSNSNVTVTDEQVCSVCFDRQPKGGSTTLILCDSCDLAVHPACYGLRPPLPEEWYCDGCNGGTDGGCRMCPVKGGARKEGGFRDGKMDVHLCCAKEAGVEVGEDGGLCFKVSWEGERGEIESMGVCGFVRVT